MMEGFGLQADKALLDTVFDGIVVIELKHLRISLANKAAADILGFDDPDDLVGVDPLKHVSPEDRDGITSILAGLVSGSTLQAGAEIRVLDKRGRDVWIMARGVRLASNGNSVLLASFRDITAQKTAEMARREAEKNQIDLFNASNELILISQNWKVVFANRSLQEAMGMSAEALVGMSILDLTHPDDREAVRRRYEQILEGKYFPSDRAFKGIGKDGRTSWGMMRHVPFTWQGKPALMTIVRDISQQRLAEEALQDSERRYRLMADNITDVIWALDMNLKTIYVSPSVMQQKGYSVEEAMNLTLEEQMSPDAIAQIVSTIQEELVLEASGSADPHRSRTAEGQTYRKDGSKYWVEITASFMRDQQGKPIGFMGITRDITERKKAEQLLRSSEEKFRLLTEKTNDIIWTTDLNLRPTYVSPSIEKVLGFTPEERLKQNVADQMTPASYARVRGRLEEELRREEEGRYDPERTIRMETEYYHKNGSTVWMENLVSALRDETGRIVGVHGVSRDVTDRRLAEDALRNSERRYRLLAENASDIIWAIDSTLKFTYVSPSVTSLLGYGTDEIIGRSFDGLLTPDSLALMAQIYLDDMAREESAPGSTRRRTVEIEAVCKNGSMVWLEAAINAVRDPEGRITGFQGACRDISEWKAAQDALKESETKYRNLFEHTLLGMEVVDAATGKVLLSNHAMARMFGFKSPAEMVGIDAIEGHILPEDMEWVLQEFARVLADPEKRDVATLRARTQDGRIIWVTGMTTSFDFEGKPAALISLLDISSAKEADLRLQESENKNRLLIDNAAEAIAVVQDGLLKFANRKFAESVGYSAEELISRPFADFIHPDDLPRIADYYVKRQKGEEAPSKYQFRWIDREGTAHWGEASIAIFKWEGRPATLCMLNDITDRKRAEDSLRESENRYRLIAENSSDVIWTMDMNLRMTYVSPSVEKLTGYSPEESILMKMEDGLMPASLMVAGDVFARAMAELERNGGKPLSPETVELEMKRKDGSTVWTEVRMSFMQDSQDKVVGIMGVARNIDERRRAGKALEESESRFRALIEGARDAIAVIDVNGKVTYRSPSAERITDGTVENLLTVSLQEKLHPDDVARATDLFTSLIRSPDGSVVDVELRYRREDGSWGVIEGRGTNWVHDPKIGGIVVNYRDITERRQAEEALRESESRHRLLAENVSDVIWSLNMRTKRVFFSPSVTRLLGYTIEEAQTMKMKQVVSPTSIPEAMMCFSNLLGKTANGSSGRSSSTQLEVELMRKDGSLIWVDVAVTLLRDAEGRPAELFGVMRDITQRRRVEEDLRTSEEYFRALIENAWDAIVIVDANGTMLYESPSSARILGYEPKEIVGTSLAEFVRPEDIAANVEMFRKFRTEPGSILMVDASFKHKDGHYIECEGTLQNFLHDPKINGIVVNYRDVTDRRRAEEAVRSSEERFRNLVEATSDWVWEADPSGIYTYVSPRVHDVMGYDVGEIIGKSMFDHMPARDSSRLARAFRAHAEKREPFAFLETSRQRKDGRVIIMETSGVPFFGSDGSLLGYRGIGRDITNRKKVERDLENSLKKVEKTMEAAIQAISYTMETRDPYTTGHQRRVTQLACAIAKEMGVAAWQIDGIRVAGLLHDIGKIAVPTEILSKPGKLSDIEFSMIKAHPKVGFDILKNVEFEWPIARIVVQHHERLDGSGYPFGLRGKDILQESRILAVADVVEAMSSHRPYRPALGIDKALAEVVRGEGTLYDTNVVRACARVIKERAFKFEG